MGTDLALFAAMLERMGVTYWTGNDADGRGVTVCFNSQEGFADGHYTEFVFNRESGKLITHGVWD